MTPSTHAGEPSTSRRVEALIESLPFIQNFRGHTFVIKYGGSAMEDEHLIDHTLRDVVLLEAVGIRPVMVHGGGKLITNRMRDAGLKAQFVNGLRVTDAASMRIVEEALDGETNPLIVKKLREFGGRAEGVSGKRVVRARRLPPQPQHAGDGIGPSRGRSAAKGALVDIGFVGEVAQLELEAVRRLSKAGTVPVISPLSADAAEEGVTLNVNADVVAAAIAAELRATKLIFISDVPGLMRDPTAADSLIPSLSSSQIKQLMHDGVISGGMIPKVTSAVEALGRGVAKVHFIDGRVAHSLLLEIFSTLGIGTEIVP